MYYLRKISRGRWPDENKILSATLEDIEAYCVINEFKPIDQNQISVWKVENEDDLTDALIALACHPADYKLPLWSDCLGLNVGENTVPLKVMGTFSSYSGNLRRSQAHVTAHGSI